MHPVHGEDTRMPSAVNPFRSGGHQAVSVVSMPITTITTSSHGPHRQGTWKAIKKPQYKKRSHHLQTIEPSRAAISVPRAANAQTSALSTPGQRRHVKILASHHPAVFTSVRESMCRCGSPHRSVLRRHALLRMSSHASVGPRIDTCGPMEDWR